MSEIKGFDSKIVELSNKKSELRERFLVASLANIAASYREALDRRGSQPYEYAQNVLSYCGINYKEVEPVEPEIRKDFSEFCKEQHFGQDPVLDQAQPEDKPESKLITGLDGVLIQAGGEENPSVTIRLDDGTDIDLWLTKIQVKLLAEKLYRRVSVLVFTED